MFGRSAEKNISDAWHDQMCFIAECFPDSHPILQHCPIHDLIPNPHKTTTATLLLNRHIPLISNPNYVGKNADDFHLLFIRQDKRLS